MDLKAYNTMVYQNWYFKAMYKCNIVYIYA